MIPALRRLVRDWFGSSETRKLAAVKAVAAFYNIPYWTFAKRFPHFRNARHFPIPKMRDRQFRHAARVAEQKCDEVGQRVLKSDLQ
jgi:hypothetical protein